MEATRWTSYSEADELPKSGVGGMGGFFDNGMRWKDYIEGWKDCVHPYIEAIRKSVIENNIRFSGSAHQHKPDGAPVFSDGTAATFSMRAWGDLMAAIWSEHENKDYCYMDFYF